MPQEYCPVEGRRPCVQFATLLPTPTIVCGGAASSRLPAVRRPRRRWPERRGPGRKACPSSAISARNRRIATPAASPPSAKAWPTRATPKGARSPIEYRWADGQYNRLPALAKELADLPLAVIVAPGGAEVVLAAKSATAKIPDRLRDGRRSRRARRGRKPVPARRQHHRRVEPQRGGLAQAAGVHARGAAGREPLRRRRSIRTSPTSESQLKNLQAAAAALGVELIMLRASTEPELEALFTGTRDAGAGGLVFSSDPYLRLPQPAARRARVPTRGGGDHPIARLPDRRRADELWRRFQPVAPPDRDAMPAAS